MSKRSRGFCFTINNYTDATIDQLAGIDARYLCYGKEVAPTTGTPHLQGYLYFANPRGFAAVRALLPAGAHLEISNGSGPQNRTYCSKGGVFHERGDCPLDAREKGETEKARWGRIVELARLGDYETILSESPDVYGLRLKTLEYLHAKRPRVLDTLQGPGPFHQWFVGPTGCGKSSRARQENPGAYIKEPESKWWDKYDDQDVAIIDDFDKFQVAQGGNLKRWLDRYPFPVEVKGGMMEIRPKKIIVTSQYHPHEIWDDQKTVDAILRRVEVVEFPTIPEMFVHTFNKPN